jgi:hypothetical protein
LATTRSKGPLGGPWDGQDAHPVSFLLNFNLGEDAGQQPRPIG